MPFEKIPFEPGEETYLKGNALKYSIKELEETTGIPYKRILRYFKDNKIEFQYNRIINPLSEKEQAYIRENGKHKTYKELASHLGISYDRVLRFALKEKIEVKRQREKKVKVESEFFDYDRMYL